MSSGGHEIGYDYGQPYHPYDVQVLDPTDETTRRAIKIKEFEENLGYATKDVVRTSIDVDAFDPTSDGVDTFMRDQYQPLPIMYFTQEITESTGDIAGFEPYVSRSGNSSFHGVFFGALCFTDGSKVDVAVKPFDDKSDAENERLCINDYFSNVAAKEMGFEGLEPVGFMLNPNGTSHSITRLDQSLDTLDSINWDRFFEDGYDNSGMQDIWYKAALQTANLHQTGDSFHGDLAARNIATNLQGHVFLIDWEYGKITNHPPYDIDARFGHTLKDMRGLINSMARPTHLRHNPGIGFFKESNDWWMDFKESFFEDYKETRMWMAQQGSHRRQIVQDTQDELTQLEYALELELNDLQQAFQ